MTEIKSEFSLELMKFGKFVCWSAETKLHSEWPLLLHPPSTFLLLHLSSTLLLLLLLLLLAAASAGDREAAAHHSSMNDLTERERERLTLSLRKMKEGGECRLSEGGSR